MPFWRPRGTGGQGGAEGGGPGTARRRASAKGTEMPSKLPRKQGVSHPGRLSLPALAGELQDGEARRECSRRLRDEAASGGLGTALRWPQPLSTCARRALPPTPHRPQRPGPRGCGGAAHLGRMPVALVHALRVQGAYPGPSCTRCFCLLQHFPGDASCGERLPVAAAENRKRSGRALNCCRRRARRAQAPERRGSSRSEPLGEAPARQASDGTRRLCHPWRGHPTNT